MQGSGGGGGGGGRDDRQGHGEKETSGEFSPQINNRLINNTAGE